MKRIVLLIGALLLGLAVQAQSVTYTCRYWFDQNFAQAATTTFSTSTWQAELDVGSLTEGLHALHLHVMDTSMKWSAPQSYLFLKLTPPAASTDFTYYYWFDQDHASMQSGALGDGHLLLDVDDLSEGLHAIHVMLKGGEYSASQSYLFFKTDAWESGMPNYVYHCWFDEDFANQQTDALGSGHLLLDVNDLEEGMHAVHVLVEGTTLTATQSYLFMKVAPFAMDSIDMSHLAYRCWFDQDFEHQQIDSVGDGHLLLDVNELEDGLHTVHVMLQGSTLTATQSYMFMKMAVQDPSAELQYICWFDQDYSNAQTGPLGSGLFELEVGDLPNGIHTVNVQLDNGSRTAPQCYLFYKQPLGGYGIARWEYWLNDDIANRQITNISPTIDTLDIISLLNVGHPAIRSSCFHFHPNGDAPYINAKNQINFRFWDSEMRFFDKSAFYVDEQVQQDIVATVFERNTTETFAAPRNNQIQWFKLDAVVGDSLAFIADKACTMQLFAPSGEEVYNVSGPESIVLGGLHAWEDGTYYLAVHDVTGSGETVSVTYNWVYRYAILAYDVHLVGNGGCSTITFNGNGYNSLLDVCLVNAQNDTIHRLDIGHESNSSTTVTFNFYEVNLGVYDAVFQFYDETIRINGALEVQEPVDIVLTSTVNYPSTFRRDTECTYTYTITNNGNMSAYGVPLYLYIETNTFSGISHLKVNGLKLKKLHEYINNFNEYSSQEKEELQLLSEHMGDDHYFFPYMNETSNGDSIAIRVGYFIVDLAPFEIRTITISMTSSESIELWLSIPNGWSPISEFTDNRMTCFDGINDAGLWNQKGDRSHFCCWHDGFEAALGGISVTAGGVAMIALFIPDLISKGAAAVAETISLASGALGAISGAVASVICEQDPPQDFMEWNSQNKGNWASLLGSLLNVASNMHPDAKILAKAVSVIGSYIDAYGVSNSLYARDEAHKSSQCTDEPPKGGKSTPVAPCEPNEIRGYLAESGSHYMMQEIQTITYEIESENDTTATAAAHTIIVRDTLDVNKFDVASLAAYRVTIGDKVLELNGEHEFIYTLDLRPALYVIAQIQQECDPETGIVVWTITSLDPMTMEPTTDPNQGALPINYSGEGIATFVYNINLKEPFPDGTEINNRVGIIFDLEEPVLTDTWTNIIDAVKPTSHIENVTFENDTLNFNFASSDNRSGVWYHSLYYRNESTDQDWKVKVPKILENSYMLRFNEYQTTEYLVMAIDSAGNREEKDMVAEYIHYYDGPVPITQIDNLSRGWNWWSTNLDITLDELKAAIVDALPGTTVTIKSRTKNTSFNPGMNQWRGTLNSLDMTQMYMIYVSVDCEITLEGMLVNPAEHPVTINNGTNWIAFPVSVNMSVDNAFAGFAVDGDNIKSRNNNASYSNGHWRGRLTSLEPGRGYMYISNAQETRVLTFPASTR